MLRVPGIPPTSLSLYSAGASAVGSLPNSLLLTPGWNPLVSVMETLAEGQPRVIGLQRAQENIHVTEGPGILCLGDGSCVAISGQA